MSPKDPLVFKNDQYHEIKNNRFFVAEHGEIVWADLMKLARTNKIDRKDWVFIGRTRKWMQGKDVPSLYPDNWLSCPVCGERAVGSRGCLITGLIILFFPLGLLLLLIPVKYTCYSCGCRFNG